MPGLGIWENGADDGGGASLVDCKGEEESCKQSVQHYNFLKEKKNNCHNLRARK